MPPSSFLSACSPKGCHCFPEHRIFRNQVLTRSPRVDKLPVVEPQPADGPNGVRTGALPGEEIANIWPSSGIRKAAKHAASKIIGHLLGPKEDFETEHLAPRSSTRPIGATIPLFAHKYPSLYTSFSLSQDTNASL